MIERRAVVEIGNGSGVVLYGYVLGSKPTLSQLLQAIPYTFDRKYAKLDNTRELLIFDPVGIWILADRKPPSLILAIGFMFEPPKWRQIDESDPKSHFDGLIRVGNIAFSPPIKRNIADRVSQMHFDEVSFFFICQGQTASGITIDFIGGSGFWVKRLLQAGFSG